MLADTSLFAREQYRAACSEQALSVALGRDTQRKLVHVAVQGTAVGL
jgi:hypothetical protein